MERDVTKLESFKKFKLALMFDEELLDTYLKHMIESNISKGMEIDSLSYKIEEFTNKESHIEEAESKSYKAKSVEADVYKEAMELLGGQEAVQAKIVEEKQQKLENRPTVSKRATNKKQKAHDKELVAKAKLLKQEYMLKAKGFKFDRTQSLEQRKNTINAAVQVEKAYAKIDRKDRIDNIKNEITGVAKHQVVAPVKATASTIKQEVMVPAGMRIGALKSTISEEIGEQKNKVSQFVKNTKKSIKTAVIGLASLGKEQAGLLARSMVNSTKGVQEKLQTKFSATKDKVTEPMMNKASKWKNSYKKNLEIERNKERTRNKEKESGREL